MSLTEQQVNHFRTFGFVVFRQLFRPDELKLYMDEFDRGLDLWVPGGQHDRQKRHHALFTYDTTPFICSLHDDPRFADVAEELYGKPMFGLTVNGNYYVGDTQGHPDSGTAQHSGIKFTIYLEPLTAADGALRLIPGSHREPLRTELAKDPQAKFGVRPEDVPCYSFESQPGDVLAFDMRCWHASFGGSDHRRMGVVVYFEDPQTPETEAITKEKIENAKKLAASFGQTVWFTPYWRSINNLRHQRWVRRLGELGVLD